MARSEVTSVLSHNINNIFSVIQGYYFSNSNTLYNSPFFLLQNLKKSGGYTKYCEIQRMLVSIWTLRP